MKADFAIDNCLFRAVKLNKNNDPDKYRYSDYGTGFDFCSQFSGSDDSWGEIFFCADMSSYVHVDNKKKDILVLGGFPTQDVDNIMITTEAKYPNNFTELRKRFVLSLHYNGSLDFSFVNAVKMYQFKAKVSEIKPYPFCIGNISKIFTFNNMKKKNRIKRKCQIFFCWS